MLASFFAASWLCLAYPWLSGDVTIPYDAKALFQAQLQFLATALHSGQSPFWNPYVFLGFPQIADPQSLIFSPAILIAYLFEAPGIGLLDAYVMALLGLSGFAILQLCLDKGWHPGAGVVAALIYSFGGSAAWRIQHVGHIQSYVFFALGLWLFVRAIDRRSIRWAIASGFAGGAMLAEPDQVALLGCYSFAIIYAGSILTSERKRQEIAATWRLAIAASAGAAAVAAIPVLLTSLFLSQSNRPLIDFAEASRGSLHPASLLSFVIGDLFGALDPKVDYWGPYSSHWNPNELTLSQNMCQIYCGALPALVVLTFGLLRGHLFDRQIRVFTTVAVIALVYAVGTYSPFYFEFYRLLPGVNAFRRPVDATFLFGAMISIVSGYLVHLWLSNQVRHASDRRKLAETGIILCVVIAASAVAISEHQFSVAWRPLVWALMWIGAGSLLLLLPDRWVRNGVKAMVVIPGLFQMTDLRLNNAPNGSTGVSPAEVSDVLRPETQNETVKFLKENLRKGRGKWRDRVEMVGLGFDWQNSSAVHGLENTLGYNPFRIGLVSRALGARDYNVGVDQRTLSPLFPSYHSMLANMTGIRFIASGEPLEAIDAHLKRGELEFVRRTTDAYIYENKHVLPRVLLVDSAAPADFEQILSTGEWPKFNPRRTVLLHRNERATLARLSGLVSLQVAEGEADDVTIEHYDHTRIELKTKAPGPRVLVVNDVWHPWWFATVDGAEARLVQANAIFRAIPVDAGAHTVRLEFKPFLGAWRQLRDKLESGDRSHEPVTSSASTSATLRN